MSKANTKKKAGSVVRRTIKSPLDLKRRLEAALRSEFTTDTVDVTNGYEDNVHILVVSRKFDGKSDYERQEILHQIINGARLTKAQIGRIGLLLAMSPAELK